MWLDYLDIFPLLPPMRKERAGRNNSFVSLHEDKICLGLSAHVQLNTFKAVYTSIFILYFLKVQEVIWHQNVKTSLNQSVYYNLRLN